MKNFLLAIEGFFSSAWKNLLDYLHIAIPEATAKVLNDLLQLADPIVADLNNQDLSGAQKREQAVSLLQGKVAQIGLDVSISLINSAVELAVLKLRATTPAPEVAAPVEVAPAEQAAPAAEVAAPAEAPASEATETITP